MKKLLCLLLSAMLVLAGGVMVLSYNDSTVYAAPPTNLTPDTSSPLLVPVSDVAPNVLIPDNHTIYPTGDVVTLFHTNDTHGRLAGSIESSDKNALSAAKIAGHVKDMRDAGCAVLLLDAGDTTHGKLSATAYSGYSVINIMNSMGYDAMAPGNHDFNYGSARLKKLDSYAKFPLLAANVQKDGEAWLTGSVIKEAGGHKIGIFGLATPETLVKSHPKNTAGLDFVSEIETARACVADLKAQGAEYIIALGHIGLDESTEVTSEDIVKAVDGIDLFIDGHSHTKLDSGKKVNNTLIVSTGEYLQNLGEVTIDFSKARPVTTATLLSKDVVDTWPERASTKKLLSAYLEHVTELSARVVGHTDETLEGAREMVRAHQTNLGSLVADALRDVAGADIALTNGGGIRATIAAGDITYNDILTVLPFGNTVVAKKILGSDVLKALEAGLSAYPETLGGYLQVSGIVVTFDPAKPAGERVVSVTVAGEPLDPDREYIVATNDFLAAGGDASPLGEGSPYAEFGPMDQVLMDYIAANGCTYEAGERVIALQ